MSTQHTPEPWPEFDSIKVGGRVTSHYAMLSEDEYNRARACVNQCDGFTSEKLESGDLVLVPRDEFRGLMQQRDELLAAAKGVQNLLAIFPDTMLREGEVQRIIDFDCAIAKHRAQP